MTIKCFMVRATHRWRLDMRRYSHSDDCPSKWGYHNGHSRALEIVTCEPEADGIFRGLPKDDHWPQTDSRWPAKCEHCDYRFTEKDPRQTFAQQIFVDDAGKEYLRRELPPGAMWYEDFESEYRRGPDGRSLHVLTPDGFPWAIDGPCSNCTLPQDRGPYGVAHRCWTRTGVPPLVSVGKQFGKTCSAGGGSIQSTNYHGFLGVQGALPGEFT